MTTITSAGSAQIYQFPPRGRFVLNVRDDRRTTGLESTPAVRAVAVSGWYHEAAIQEADQLRSN